jgi:hypothetical protein
VLQVTVCLNDYVFVPLLKAELLRNLTTLSESERSTHLLNLFSAFTLLSIVHFSKVEVLRRYCSKFRGLFVGAGGGI